MTIREYIAGQDEAIRPRLTEIYDTIRAAIKMVPGVAPEDVTMIRIRSTLDMDVIQVSENLLSCVSIVSTSLLPS